MNDSSEEIILECPKCDLGKEPKLSVNPDLGVFHCFRCGFKGTIQRLANLYPNLYSRIEDSISLSVFNRLRLYTEANRRLVLDASVLDEIGDATEVEYGDPHYDYLISRGWTDELITSYAPLKSANRKYINRVIVPVSCNGLVVYFTARDITGNASRKYMNPVKDKDFIFTSKSSTDLLTGSDAFICEGIFDAFKLKDGCAILGKTLSKAQHTPLYKFLKSKKSIYICLDPGTKGESDELAIEIDSWFVDKDVHVIDWASSNSDVDLGDLSKVMTTSELASFIKQNSSPAKLLKYI